MCFSFVFLEAKDDHLYPNPMSCPRLIRKWAEEELQDEEDEEKNQVEDEQEAAGDADYF